MSSTSRGNGGPIRGFMPMIGKRQLSMKTTFCTELPQGRRVGLPNQRKNLFGCSVGPLPFFLQLAFVLEMLAGY